MPDVNVEKKENECPRVVEMYVYYWYCSHCDTDNSVSSTERLTYFECENCKQIIVQSYKIG